MLSTNFIMFLNQELGSNEYPQLTNEEVVDLFVKGRCKFNQVLIRYKELIIKKSQTWVPGYNSDELYQELATRLFHCCNKYRPETHATFLTFLYQSLDNHIKWLFRREGSDRRSANSYLNSSYESLVDEGYDRPNPWGPFCEEEQKSVSELVCGLVLSNRELVCLNCLFDGQQKADIAKTLGLSRTRISKIFKDMGPKFQFLHTYNENIN